MADEVSERVEAMGEMWGHQTDPSNAELTYESWPWLVFKGLIGILILTAVYLLYSLKELPWTLFGSVPGMAIWCAAPFLVGFTLGFSMENVKMALVFSILVGLTGIIVMFYLLNLPYANEVFAFGNDFSIHIWWSVILSFINMISFLPIGAVVAASVNIYE